MATCSDGDSFYVDADATYEDLGTMNGCYQDAGGTFNLETAYFRDGDDESDGTPLVYASDLYTTDPIWVLAHHDTVEELFIIRCRDADEQEASTLHPTEVVQWNCANEEDFEFTLLDYATATCGCPSSSPYSSYSYSTSSVRPTPEPTSPSTPEPTSPTTPAPVDPNACGATESFRIKSDQLTEAEGCFETTEESFATGNLDVWSVTGGLEYDQFLVFAISDDGTEDSFDSPYLLTYFGEAESNRITYCISNEDAITVHPADATWTCDMDGSGGGNALDPGAGIGGGAADSEDSFVAVTDSDIAFICGTVAGQRDPIWVLAHHDTIEEVYRIRCRDANEEEASTLHPTEVVQWNCVDELGEFTNLDYVTTTCGCPSTSSSSSSVPATPAPTSPSTPEPTSPTTPAPVDPNACGATESFRIKSDELTDAEGCFRSTQESFANPGSTFEVWTVSGNTNYGQMVVFGLADDGTGEVDDTPYLLAYLGSGGANDWIAYCHSNENAITVHPADATWLCDMDGVTADSPLDLSSLGGGGTSGSDSFVPVTDAEISFTCGCATPAPSQPEPTPSPTPGSSSSAVPLGPVIGGCAAVVVVVLGIALVKRRRGSKESKKDASGTPRPVVSNASGGGSGKGGSVPPFAPPAYSEPNPPKAELYSPGDGGLPPPPPYSGPSPSRGCRDANEEEASTLHPTEVVQWNCVDDFGKFSRLDSVTTTCGCPGTSSVPTSVPTTPAPTTPTTPAPVDRNACGATESFRIKSDQLTVLEGCFQATQESFANPGATFESDSPYVSVYFGEAANDRITYCLSIEEGVRVHPADATWQCDMHGSASGNDPESLLGGATTDTDSFVLVTDADISFIRGRGTMRLAALALLLSSRLGWSFQIGSPSCGRHGLVRQSSAGVSSRAGCTALMSSAPRPDSSGHQQDRAVAPDEPLGAVLKRFVTGLVTATLVLGADPGTGLADAGAPPAAAAAASSSSPAVSAGAGEEAREVVPTVKLEGELAAQFQKAQAAGSTQQFDKAKKLYNQVVKYAPGYVYGWSNRANVLIAEGDLQGAVRDYDRALELAEGVSMPDKWIIHLNRGTTLMALGEDDRAMSDFNQAASLNRSKDLFTLANRAQAFERKGDWGKALADYEGAINVQPGNVQPWWIRYALVLFQEGRDFDSLAFLRRVQAKFEGVGEVQAALTAVEFGRGDMKEAERSWRGINVVDQQMYLKDGYLKDQLKWPPRMVESLKAFGRQKQQADVRPADGASTMATT
eukprot:g5239.t1